LLVRDISESIGNVILSAKKHWEVTQEKLRISRVLSHLSPFAPQSVRTMIEDNPEISGVEKEKREVSILFLDLEGYTRLSARRSEVEVREMIEKLFSSFVDPVHRSHGDIVETAGDGLMIVFKEEDAKSNAINAVKAAFDIYERTQTVSNELRGGLEPLRVNVGINSGIALVGMTRFTGSSGIRMTYTATGTTTNLAARLAAYAHGGDILVGSDTKRLVEGLWTIYDRGNARLKGIDEPVKIYSLLRGNGS
jgi:class 3 adenylate cyclase